jgi:hypothetical protein
MLGLKTRRCPVWREKEMRRSLTTPSIAFVSASASATWLRATTKPVSINGFTGNVWASRRSRWAIGCVLSARSSPRRRSSGCDRVVAHCRHVPAAGGALNTATTTGGSPKHCQFVIYPLEIDYLDPWARNDAGSIMNRNDRHTSPLLWAWQQSRSSSPSLDKGLCTLQSSCPFCGQRLAALERAAQWHNIRYHTRWAAQKNPRSDRQETIERVNAQHQAFSRDAPHRELSWHAAAQGGPVPFVDAPGQLQLALRLPATLPSTNSQES